MRYLKDAPFIAHDGKPMFGALTPGAEQGEVSLVALLRFLADAYNPSQDFHLPHGELRKLYRAVNTLEKPAFAHGYYVLADEDFDVLKRTVLHMASVVLQRPYIRSVPELETALDAVTSTQPQPDPKELAERQAAS